MGRIQAAIRAKVEQKKEFGKLTQKELANALGCSQANISHLLKGARGLSEHWIISFCDVLGITLGDLEKPTPPDPDPKELRENIAKLKRLYEVSRNQPLDGFTKVSLFIDDWLEIFNALNSRPPMPAEQPVIKPVMNSGVSGRIEGLPVIDYSDPRHEHDAPREEIYEELPFFDDFRVPAGKPNEVIADGRMSVRKVVRHLARGNRYVIRVTGDSMEPRIQNGNLVLVDYAREPRPGNIVIALVDGAALIKKFLRRRDRVLLRSLNPKYEDLVVTDAQQFMIAGVVLRIVEGAL